MKRVVFIGAALALGLWAQQQKPPEPVPEEPPEEDVAAKPKEYSFNPLQAEKEVRVGDFYLKKGNVKAAAMRYSEATKWNPGDPEAWLKLGETQEKMKDLKAARESYARFVELAPDSKKASELKKKLPKKN